MLGTTTAQALAVYKLAVKTTQRVDNMLELKKIGDRGRVGVYDPILIAGKICKFSISTNSHGVFCFKTVWSYDDEAAFKSDKHCGTYSNHTWNDNACMLIHSGKIGEPDYKRAEVEITPVYDSRSVKSSSYPYRYREERSNVGVLVELTKIFEPNQTHLDVIVDTICGP